MSPLPLRARVLLVVSFLLPPCVARADPVGFSYSWSIAAGDLNASGAGPISLSQTAAPDGSGVSVNYGGGSTTLTVATAGSASATAGAADFASATPAVISMATLATPALTGEVGTFSFSANHAYTLHLTDTASGQSGDLSLFGSVTGNVGPAGTSVGASTGGDIGQTVTLGGHAYSADAFNASGLSSPGDDPQSLVAQVYIDRPDLIATPDFPPLAGNSASADLPEPSSLFLAGCALSCLGGSALRKRARGKCAIA